MHRGSRRKRATIVWTVAVVLVAGAASFLMMRRSESSNGTPPAGPGGAPFARPLPTTDDLKRGFSGSGVPTGTPQVRHFNVVDVNTASLDDLETLPGITHDYAQKIAAGRPFRTFQELERVGIPHAIVEQISPPAIIRMPEAGPVAVPDPAPRSGAPPLPMEKPVKP